MKRSLYQSRYHQLRKANKQLLEIRTAQTKRITELQRKLHEAWSEIGELKAQLKTKES